MLLREAIKENLDLYIDHIFIKFLGFCGTGVFGLYELIGHDVMSLIYNPTI